MKRHSSGSPYSVESSSSSSPSQCFGYSNGSSPSSFHGGLSPNSNSISGNSPHQAGNSPHQAGNSPLQGLVQDSVSPYLHIFNKPQTKFRFRYASEMTGTHGCLMAESTDRNRKEYIQLQLIGCQEREAIIRSTLVTNSPKPVPHVHRLGGDGTSNGNESNDHYQEIVVSTKNNWTATFSGLTIIHTAKKQVREVVEKRMLNEKIAAMNGVPLNHNQERQVKDEAEKIANTMDLHSVKLKFEAFVERNGFREPIASPIYSSAIHNLKSTHAGDLRIVRIDKVHGCCSGQEEIYIFVEKVNKKDIKIRFFETDENGHVTWSAFADFSELDVHHQYAIAFKTPPYQDQNIQSDVTVQFQLYRPSNETYSEAKSFTYTPLEYVGVKRPRLDARSISHSGPFNRRPFNPQPSPPSSKDEPSRETIGGIRSGDNSGPQDNFALRSTYNSHTNEEQIVNQPNTHNLVFQNEEAFQQLRPQHQQLNNVYHFGPENLNERSPLGKFIQPVQEDQGINFSPNMLRDINQHVQVNPWITYPAQNTAPAPQEIGNINVDSISAELLQQLLSDGYFYATDASSSVDRLASQIEQVDLNKDKKAKSPSNNQNKSSKNVPFIVSSAMLKTYSMNLAEAIHCYAETGEIARMLKPLRHLMAIQSEDGNNALHEALIHNQLDVIPAMLQAVPFIGEFEFVNTQNNSNQTPLHIAVLKNQKRAVALLMENGAIPNLADCNGNTPFHFASQRKNDCLQLLLSSYKTTRKLELNLRNYEGLTPLHLAVDAMDSNNVKLLLSNYNCDVNCFEAKRGRSPLQFAVKRRALNIIELLLQNPLIDVNQQSYDGCTALHIAVMNELDDVCVALLNRGADSKILNFVSAPSAFSEENDDSESDVQDEDEEPVKELCQSPLDLAALNPHILNILKRVQVTTKTQLPSQELTNDKKLYSSELDSGLDLMTSKELLRELDGPIIKELASLLDSPNKDWIKLADSMGVFSTMRSVLEKQRSPTTYLLENLDLWEITPQNVSAKLRQLNFEKAATLLEDYMQQ